MAFLSLMDIAGQQAITEMTASCISFAKNGLVGAYKVSTPP